MDLGNNILELRKKLQLSQEKLGEKIGVTRQITPCTYQLIALSKALNVSINTLLENDIQNLPEEKFSLDIPVFVISQKELKNLLNSALHWWDADEKKEHFNIYLHSL